MKKSRAIVALIAAVLLIVVALVAPYFIGLRVESRFRNIVTDFSQQSDGLIEITNYRRGWFGAEATTVFHRDGTHTVFEHAINHGPWFNFALATVKSVPDFGDYSESGQWNFDGPPLTITTQIAFSGGYTAQLQAARATATKPASHGSDFSRLQWDGLTGQFSEHDGRASLTLDASKVGYSDNEVQIVLEEVHINSNSSTYKNLGAADVPVDWPASLKVSIDKASICNKALTPTEPPRLVTGLELEALLRQPENDTLDYTAHLVFSDLSFEPPSALQKEPIHIDSGELSFGLTGLQANAMEDLLINLRQVNEQAGLDTEAARERASDLTSMYFMAHLPALLEGHPKLTIEIPSMQTDQGALGAKIEAALVSSSNADNTNVPSFARALGRLTVDAQGFLDKTLMHWSRADAAPAVERRHRQIIQQLAQRDLITESEGRIATKLHYDADKLVINGEEVPPAFLLMLVRGLSS